MKKLLFVVFVLCASAVSAQNYMVVDSEKVFKSIASYNSALETVEADAAKYQKQIDDAFDQLEQTFNDYQGRKAQMSATERAQTEQRIVAREDEITKFQQETFGEDGTVLKRRVELIKPIEDRVFSAIEKFAADRGYDIVIDLASNPTILYHKPAADHTNDIISIIK